MAGFGVPGVAVYGQEGTRAIIEEVLGEATVAPGGLVGGGLQAAATQATWREEVQHALVEEVLQGEDAGVRHLQLDAQQGEGEGEEQQEGVHF